MKIETKFVYRVVPNKDSNDFNCEPEYKILKYEIDLANNRMRVCGWNNWHKIINDYFTTQEEAEFALRYQNITRTEKLSLPTWEELKGKIGEGKAYKIYFNDAQFLFVSSFIIEVGKYDTNGEQIEQYFCEGTHKENYLEACELCRKLFLGEEVE